MGPVCLCGTIRQSGMPMTGLSALYQALPHGIHCLYGYIAFAVSSDIGLGFIAYNDCLYAVPAGCYAPTCSSHGTCEAGFCKCEAGRWGMVRASQTPDTCRVGTRQK